MSMYSRARHVPSGSSAAAAARAPPTGGSAPPRPRRRRRPRTPVRSPSSAPSRRGSRRAGDLRSSAVIPGSRTMLRNVSSTSLRTTPRSTIFRPFVWKPSWKLSRALGENPPGSIAPMSVTCTKLATKPRQHALEEDRRDHVHVRRVQRRRVRVVEEEGVVLVDPRVLGELGDDVLHRLRGARQVVEEPDAADHQAAVGLVERGHHVVALVRDRASPRRSRAR